jgi:hypothetical protein
MPCSTKVVKKLNQYKLLKGFEILSNMKIILVIFLTITTLTRTFGQCHKIKVALVSDLDTFFSLLSSEQIIEFEINMNHDWYSYYKTALDSDKYDVGFEIIPQQLKGIINYTNGFSKANSKYSNWFSDLHKNKGYDLIIFLCRAQLRPSILFYHNLSEYSYGMDIEDKCAFSLNRVLIFNALDSKILGEVGLNKYSDYIMHLDKNKRINKPVEQIELDDISQVKEIIAWLNKNIALRVCKKVRSLESTN